MSICIDFNGRRIFYQKKSNKPKTLCCGEQVDKSNLYKFRTRFGITKANGIQRLL